MSLRDILLALVLLTRLPLPQLPETAFDRQAKAAWAYPLAGLAVALPACALGALALAAGLPAGPAAGLVIAAQVLLTGAMHEDGLADVADGFWGGFTKARRLEIMKDSRIGAYGVIALVLGLGLRWSALTALMAAGGLWALIGVAALSRAPMAVLMAALPNARHAGLSQMVGRPARQTAAAAGVLGAASVLLFAGAAGLAAIAGAALAAAALAAVARAKIGGQTGDVLGASQQLGEIAALLALLAVL